MRVSLINYAMPLKSQNIRFCANQVNTVKPKESDYFPDLMRKPSNYEQIVASEREQMGLNSLPFGRVIDSRGSFVWDLALKKATTPADIATKLLELAPGEVKAFDAKSRHITQSLQIQPMTVVRSWIALTLKGASLVVEAFRGLLDRKSSPDILAALEIKAAELKSLK